MIDIANGPTKEELIKAFADRQEIIFNLENGTMQRVVINQLQHEDGSGYSFKFVTMSGVKGYYNARKRQGIINPPKK